MSANDDDDNPSGGVDENDARDANHDKVDKERKHINRVCFRENACAANTVPVGALVKLGRGHRCAANPVEDDDAVATCPTEDLLVA